MEKNEHQRKKPATKKRTKAKKPPHLVINNLGPIRSADVTFGDLTVIVGQQATGKSVFLQTLKLLIDRDHIHDTFKHHNMSFKGRTKAFLEAYYGRGMSSALGAHVTIKWCDKEISLESYAKPSKGTTTRYERVFYIPAQRVMSLPGGVSQNFGQFNYGDPYTLRSFSDAVHDLIQNEFGGIEELFPAPNKLNDTLRKPIDEHLFGGNKLVIHDVDFTKKLGLAVPETETPLGFLSWSAGQREFVPMLMGLYWLCPPTQRRKTGKKKSETIEWVIVEEPEMGLHPQGVTAVLLLVLELLRRGYRVVLSTHSLVVLEMVWALKTLKNLEAEEADVRSLFNLPATPAAKELSKSALNKNYFVYYFDRRKQVRDISSLDINSEELQDAEWGGLNGFSSSTNRVVAEAVNKAESRLRRRRNTHTSDKGV